MMGACACGCEWNSNEVLPFCQQRLRVGTMSGADELKEYASAMSGSNTPKNRDLSRIPCEWVWQVIGRAGRADRRAPFLQWTSTEFGSGTTGTSTSMPAPSRYWSPPTAACTCPTPHPHPSQGYSREVSYLVTQHPLQDTRYDFWLMTLQHRVNTVVMVGPLDDQQPQALYWQTDQPLVIKGITITLETEVQSKAFRRLDFTVSAPKVSSSVGGAAWPVPTHPSFPWQDDYDPLEVSLYHFYSWPSGNELVAMAPQWVSFVSEVERGSHPPIVLHTTPR